MRTPHSSDARELPDSFRLVLDDQVAPLPAALPVARPPNDDQDEGEGVLAESAATLGLVDLPRVVIT